MQKRLFGIAALIAAALSTLTAGAAENLLPEGSFEVLDDEGRPQLFSLPHPNYQASIGAEVKIEREGENRFLRLIAHRPGTVVHFAASIPVPPSARALRIKFRVRSTDFERAPEPAWSSVRMGGAFLDAAGQPIHPGYLRVTRSVKGNTGGEWVTLEETLTVPEGAARIRVQPGIYYGQGTVDFDDIEVYDATDEAAPAPEN